MKKSLTITDEGQKEVVREDLERESPNQTKNCQVKGEKALSLISSGAGRTTCILKGKWRIYESKSEEYANHAAGRPPVTMW